MRKLSAQFFVSYLLRGSLFLLVVLVHLASTAKADPVMTGFSHIDYFIKADGDLSEEKKLGLVFEDSASDLTKIKGVQHNFLDDSETFTTQILRLLILAGYDSKPPSLAFVDNSIPIPEIYPPSMVWKMKREIQKPIPGYKRPFAKSFSSLETHVKKLIVTKARARREFLAEHY